MQEHKIFLITPLGAPNTADRRHADKMWNHVFTPLSEENLFENAKIKFVRSDLLEETGRSRVQEIMDLIRESRGCIVDLHKIDNLNVIYEVGLAHSQGKRVFFLRSDKIQENDVPSDIRYYSDYYHLYNVETFNGNASSEEVSNIKKRVLEVVRAMISTSTVFGLYRPSFYKPTEMYVSDMLESINGKIANLEKLLKDFGTSSEDERTLAQYIIGENEAFKALTDSIQKSSFLVKTTRFSPYSVVDRQNTFFNAINELMSHQVHPESFERIIAANNVEKFTEVVKLMVNNAGHNFKIYISKIEYSFEMVIVDDEEVFIHFRKYNTPVDERPPVQPPLLISSTLKIEKRLIASEFSAIFDSIKCNSKDIICVIDCKHITTENLEQEIQKYRSLFLNAVKEFETNLNPKI